MKQFILFSAIVFFGALSVKAQESDSNTERHEVSFDFTGFTSPLLTKVFFGGNMNTKYYPTKKWATGVDFSFAQKKIENTFNYPMGTPIINYYEIGWINQYDFVQTDKFRLGATLNNGIAISCLGDNDDRVPKNRRYGTVYVPRGIATDNLYIIEPGFAATYCVYSEKHEPDIYLTTVAKYRFAFGGAKYGDVSDFNGSYIGVGISLIGFMQGEANKE